jgi:superfamily I DNA/RNA helicase
MKQLMEDRRQLRLGDFFQDILDSTGYLEILKEESQPGSQDRIDNLQELVNAAAEGCDAGGVFRPCLARFRSR